VTIHLDTSALVDALTGPRRSLERLIELTADGHRLLISTIVLYEWLRGPRTTAELATQEQLFPSAQAVPFGLEEATTASRIYKAVPRPRGREIDLAVAASAVAAGARLWTLNPADFRDIAGLQLV
jgi:predicted nucleic acid-binding protein